jgi:WD40 repeat protein
VLATGAAILLVPAGCVSYAAWQEDHGPPIPLSQGAFGAAFSPDGQLVAILSPGLELWDTANRAHPQRLAYTHGDVVMPGIPAFSPDGRVLATAGGGSGVLWNVADPARLTQVARLPGPGGTGVLLFSPDGRVLAAADNGTVILWNVTDPARATRIATLTGQAGGISALSFSPDGHLLASGSVRGTVDVWNLAGPARATRLATLTGQAGGISALSFSSGGHLLASASDQGTVVVRNLTNPAAPVTTATLRLTVPPEQFPGVPDVTIAFSGSGRTLTTITGNRDHTVTLWNVTGHGTVTRVAAVTGTSIGPGSVAFSAATRTVAGPPTTGDTLALWTLPVS